MESKRVHEIINLGEDMFAALSNDDIDRFCRLVERREALVSDLSEDQLLGDAIAALSEQHRRLDMAMRDASDRLAHASREASDRRNAGRAYHARPRRSILNKSLRG